MSESAASEGIVSIQLKKELALLTVSEKASHFDDDSIEERCIYIPWRLTSFFDEAETPLVQRSSHPVSERQCSKEHVHNLVHLSTRSQAHPVSL